MGKFLLEEFLFVEGLLLAADELVLELGVLFDFGL